MNEESTESLIYLKENFPFLNPGSYFDSLKELPDWFERDGQLLPIPTIEEELRKRRNSDFQKLVDESGSLAQESSGRALQALYQIAIDPISTIGKEECQIDFQGTKFIFRTRSREFQISAAESLVSLLKTGADPNSEIAKLVIDGLSESTNSRVRMEFLKGIHKLTAYESGTDYIGLEILKNVAQSELSRAPAQQDREFQAALVDSLVYLKKSSSLSVLTVLKDSPFEAVSKQVESMIALIQLTKDDSSNL